MTALSMMPRAANHNEIFAMLRRLKGQKHKPAPSSSIDPISRSAHRTLEAIAEAEGNLGEKAWFEVNPGKLANAASKAKR
jgi:hypothetical protein